MFHDWLAPAEPLADDDRAKAVEYLGRQGRADLAVWAGYRLRAGGAVDHELMIRLRGRRPGKAELHALFWGFTYEMPIHCYVGFPTRTEMREARRVGQLIWERTGRPPIGTALADLLRAHFSTLTVGMGEFPARGPATTAYLRHG